MGPRPNPGPLDASMRAAEAGELEVRYSVQADLVHTSFAFAGLRELALRGELALRPWLGELVRKTPAQWAVARFQVRGGAGGWRNVAVDFHDVSALVCAHSMRWCDVYFKANCARDTLESAEKLGAAARVRPFGPYFTVAPDDDRWRWPRLAGSVAARYRWMARDGGVRRAVRPTISQLGRLRRYRERGPLRRYEVARGEGAFQWPGDGEPLVFFQATCWPEPTSEALNLFRYDLIRGLRRELGERFRGGFSRNELALRRYRDVVVDPLPQEEFSRLFLRTPIAPNTVGLSSCFSWRLCESFAAGRAVAAQTQHADLTFEAREENGILCRDTPEALVAVIAALAGDPARTARMAAAASRVYDERLRPPAAMRRAIDEALR